jgi:hypothetical protein
VCDVCGELQGVHEFASIDLYAKGLLLGDILYCNVCRRSILNALGGLQCVGTPRLLRLTSLSLFLFLRARRVVSLSLS